MKKLLLRTCRPFVVAGRGTRHLFARLPIDLVGVAGFVAIAAALLTVVDPVSRVVRAAIGVPLLFLAPGYATVATLFPRAAAIEASESNAVIGQTVSVTDLERVALSFGLSVAVLPLLGLLIGTLSLAFTGTVVVGTVSAVTLIGTVVAAIRRVRIPPEERYRLHLGRKLGAVRSAMFGTDSVVHATVNVVLVVSLCLAFSSVGYALVSPQQGEQYTSVQLLTENESGEPVADGYPDAIEPGDSVPLTIALENREGEDAAYTIVVQEQWLDGGEVHERTELARFDERVDDGETSYTDRSVTPEAESGTVRITVLLYEDGVPETATTDNAYRYAYVWVDLTEDGGDE
ncbi:DUF1616 domain-containing protein [Halopiger djelfimassiliensis]|uniref:DUF1616 domain-containing protein n=1 Tax=Halopiger djelfimassiliensis TaxID=1293047 RepID=UPI000677A3C1|nr:DUF1616 domain-containing protein [Halopiger djelfimassiliensis]